MAEKKPDPNATPPQKNLFVIGVVLLILGALWSVYEANPGGALRAETEAEKKERRAEEDRQKEKERDEKRRRKH